MPIQYTTVQEGDFSHGIDVRSAENQIAEGYVRDLLNADVIEKRVRKRPGYQGYAGNIPVRVTGLQYVDATNQICFTLDSAVSLDQSDVDLNAIRSTPIVVYGRSSSISSGGPFTTAGDTVRYYSALSIPTRKVLLATSSAPPFESLTIPESEHGITTTNMFVSLVESTSPIDRSHQSTIQHDIILDESSFAIEIDYQNSTGSNIDSFVYYKDQTPATGSAYTATLVHGGGGSQTFTITAATHGLSNFNILPQIQEDRGTTRAQVEPSSLIVQTNGDVVITLIATTATTFYALLASSPIANQVSGNITGSSTSTLQVPGLTSPWLFWGIYLEQTPGGNRELVLPDFIAYDDATTTATVSFTNAGASAANFFLFYDYGTIRSNQLCVTDASVTVDATDTRPQLTIWGLDHAEIYGQNRNGRAGWTNHLDSYRSAGDRRLIAGLGGNLFTARTFAEAGTAYDYAQLYPNLQARTATSKVIGPLFWQTADTPARTRGYVTAADSGTNWAQITAVSFDTGNGWTRYTLSLPGKAILDSTGTPTTLSAVISTTTSLEDWLTVQQMPYAHQEGVFRIRQILDGTNAIDVWVENAENSADYDDAHTGGEAAVFTDQITWLTSAPFIPGDFLTNAALGDATPSAAVLSSLSTVSVIGGLTERIDLAGGLLTSGMRTSSVIPLRSAQPSAVSSTTNLVRGDMLSYTDIERELRVLYVHTDSDRSVNINTSVGIATVTMLTGDTTAIIPGSSILLTQAGAYSGEQVVLAITSTTAFTFSTTETVTVTGATLLGSTMQVDEQLSWQDSSDDSEVFQVVQRWIPVEAPDDSYNLTPSTYIRHFDSNAYGNQPFLRSTMVLDNMYFTDYQDEVLKFDGTNVYRAGLFPWQPGLFITQDTGATAKLVVDNPTATPTAVVDNVFTLPLGDEQKFPAGQRIRHSYVGGFTDYTVLSTYTDTSNGFVKVQRVSTTAITLGTTPLLTLLSVLRYYFRLNAVDANNNIIASAVTGSQDHVVELASDAAVNLRLVGFPVWDNYDYDRLEVEIYRTKINTVAPFYRVTTIQMDFDLTQGYVDYTDTFTDSDLVDLDVVSTALKGQELGIAWQEPIRAKYITSIGNKLVLGNIRDYPQLDIQVIASPAATNALYDGKIVTFRRDNTDTGTTTDMINRARYQFVSGSTGAAGTYVIGVNTFSFVATGLPGATVAGDWIYLSYGSVGTTNRDLHYGGWWQIAIVAGTTVTVNLVGAAAATSYPDRYTVATDPTDIPVHLGTDGNMGMVNGSSFFLFDLMRRLSMSVNTTMRMVDTSLTGMSTFVPWITARGGNDVNRAGRLLIRQPRATSTTLEVELPSSFSGGGFSFDMFVNDTRRVASEQISAAVRIYPSRLLVSYENYPEILDSPGSVLSTDSDSAIDVNSADGQEITGIIPFFGDAAFGAAQQSAILVVFKSNSLYLVDLNEKAAGRNPVQRIETEGLGCTAPFSIAVTKNGVIFANESGIYCLRRNQAIQYIGKFMERNWLEQVNRDQLDIIHGHHYGIGRSYKISVPIGDETENSQVYVYNHTAEDLAMTTGGMSVGAWSRYDNHPAIGWANLDSDAFFASTRGRVYSLRRTGSTTDLRDDNEGIHFLLDLRAMDFGVTGLRKVVDSILVNYRTLSRNTGTTVSFSVDLQTEYRSSTQPIIPKPVADTGIDDQVPQDIVQIRHSTDRRRCIYFQTRIENSTIDESLEIAGIAHKVGGLTEKGILSAKGSQSK